MRPSICFHASTGLFSPALNFASRPADLSRTTMMMITVTAVRAIQSPGPGFRQGGQFCQKPQKHVPPHPVRRAARPKISHQSLLKTIKRDTGTSPRIVTDRHSTLGCRLGGHFAARKTNGRYYHRHNRQAQQGLEKSVQTHNFLL